MGLPVVADGGKVAWRAYSIASPPSEKRHVELFVRHAIAPVCGKFTSALWELPVGGGVQHRGITGPFTIEERRPDGTQERRRLLLVAGGTGVAPFISYALELAHGGAPRELIVLHGASYVQELAYAAVLQPLEERTRLAPAGAYRLRYVPSVSRPHEEQNRGWKGETGRVETLLLPAGDGRPSRVEEILASELTPEAFACHACGFDGTVKAVLAALEPRGFRSHRHRREDGSYDLKYESYG
jgi:ferredoxin--NADP+ reductase